MTTTRRSLLGLADAACELRPGGAFDQFVAAQAVKDEFSGTVLLTHQGRTILARSYGMADKQLSIPHAPDTIFALASVTKLFTAVAIAQLTQRGKVAYGEKVSTYLGGLPADITVDQLLTHTSGLGDYRRTQAFRDRSAAWGSADEVLAGIMTIIRESTVDFAPGVRFGYSNSAYEVLGAIVAQVSGQSYYDYIREHIFAAAGMTSTDFYTRPQWREDRRIAHPYHKLPSGERVDVLQDKIFMGTAAGDAFSTCGDLDRFARALVRHKLLNPAYTRLTLSGKLAMRPPPGPTPLTTFQCYGPLALLNHQWMFTHNGGAPGESTEIQLYPESNWVAVILSNYDMGTASPIAALANQLITAQRA